MTVKTDHSDSLGLDCHFKYIIELFPRDSKLGPLLPSGYITVNVLKLFKITENQT